MVALAALVGLAWVVALWYLRVTTHPAVLSWERLSRLRGLSHKRPLGDRVGARLPVLRRLQAETDIGHLLVIAGQPQGASAWSLKTGATAGATLAGLLLLDELTLLANGRLAFPPGLALAATVTVGALAYVRLRNRAHRRQQALERAVADSLPHADHGVISARRGGGQVLELPVEKFAVEIFGFFNNVLEISILYFYLLFMNLNISIKI